MAWLVAGLWVAKSIHLSRMALHLLWPIQKASMERRLSRFLHNRAVRVAVWYEPVARQLVVQAVATLDEMRLVLDTTPAHHRAQVVIVSLAFRRRALRLAWTKVNQGRGHSSSIKQIALLARVRRWLPKGTPVSVVGDNEFGSVALIRQLEAWGWNYALRQKGSTLVCLPTGTWTALEDVVTALGESRWYENVLLTEHHRHRCHWYASLANLKYVRRLGWHWFTRLKANRLVLVEGNRKNHPVSEWHIPHHGRQMHLKGYVWVKVFKTGPSDGREEYWATSRLDMTIEEAAEYAQLAWQIEVYHQGLKQYTSIERGQFRAPIAQRNHIGLAIQA